MTTGLVLFGLAFFIALIALLALFQRSMIYPVPPIDGSVPDGFTQVSYETQDGLLLKAGYRAAKDGLPTLLFFHGNAVSWQSTQYTTELAVAQGYGVLAASYRGYDGNAGSPHEAGLYMDGQAALSWLEEQGLDHSEIVLVGNSLGSGVATELAQQIEPHALILVAPFKSMTATAANRFPWAPVEYLLWDRFANIAKIDEVSAPVLVVHGTDDQLIPVDHARELAAAHPMGKFVALPGFPHNMSGSDEAQLPQLEFLRSLRD